MMKGVFIGQHVLLFRDMFLVKVEDFKVPARLLSKPPPRVLYLLPGRLARAGEVECVAVEKQRRFACKAQAIRKETACRLD